MILVIDANVALKWFLDELRSSNARALLESDHVLIAPAHALAEIGHVMARRVRDRAIRRDQLDRALVALPRIMIQFELRAIVELAADIAVATAQSYYDCLYIAAAVRWNGLLVTSDERMIRAISGTPWSAWVRLLGTELAPAP